MKENKLVLRNNSSHNTWLAGNVLASVGSTDAEENVKSDVGKTSPRGPTRTATTGSALAVRATVAVEN